MNGGYGATRQKEGPGDYLINQHCLCFSSLAVIRPNLAWEGPNGRFCASEGHTINPAFDAKPTEPAQPP